MDTGGQDLLVSRGRWGEAGGPRNHGDKAFPTLGRCQGLCPKERSRRAKIQRAVQTPTVFSPHGAMSPGAARTLKVTTSASGFQRVGFYRGLFTDVGLGDSHVPAPVLFTPQRSSACL